MPQRHHSDSEAWSLSLWKDLQFDPFVSLVPLSHRFGVLGSIAYITDLDGWRALLGVNMCYPSLWVYFLKLAKKLLASWTFSAQWTAMSSLIS